MLQRFNNLNLGYKINLGFATLVLVLLLIVGSIFAAGRAATNRINLTVDVRVPTTLAATSAQSNLLKMQAAVRGYLAVSDLQNIDDYNQARERFQRNLAELKALSIDWTNQQDIERLNQLIDIFAIWLSTPEQLFTLHDNPLENQPALRLETINAQPLNAALLEDLERLVEQLQQQRATPQTATPTTTLVDGFSDFRASFEGMSTNLSAYAATGDLLFKLRYSEELVTNSRQFGQLVAFFAVDEQRMDNTNQVLFQQITEARTILLQLSLQIFAAVEGEQSHLDLYLFQNEMEPKTEQMVALLESLVLSQNTLLQSELNDGNRSLANLRYQTLLGGVMVLLLGAAMVYIFWRNIAKPLHRLSRTAERIGSGELTARADVETDDEIGQLAVSFNRMTSQLSDTFQALAEAKESAETASRAKSRFLASMSHELRTPLNVMLGYVQILQRKSNQTDTQTDALDAIHSNGEHLLNLINDILDLSKIEASKLELQRTQFVLADFLDEIVQGYRSRSVEQEQIDFVAQISPTLPSMITADEKRLRQILLNLLENAFKFTTEGQVQLIVALVERTDDTACLSFTVLDTGIGMTEQEQALIFRLFEQVGPSSQRAKGTGLGLAIVQELVDAMNGELTVSSAPQQGSSFSVTASFPAEWGKQRLSTRTSDLRITFPAREHERTAASSDQRQATQLQTLAIPDRELDALIDMALKGELLNLEQKSVALARQNAANQPLFDRLQPLIKQYEEDKIIELLYSLTRNRHER